MIAYYFIVLISSVPNHPWFGSEIGGVTVFKIAGAIAVLYAIFHMGVRGTFPGYFSTWPVRFYMVLVLIAFASYVTLVLKGSAWGAPVQIYVSCVLLFFVTKSVVDSQARFRLSLYFLMGANALASLYTVREWQMAGFSYYRPGYVAGDSNMFAASVLLTIPLSYYLFREKRPAWERRFSLGCLALTVVAFIAASSRGALVGLGLGLLYLLVRSERRFSFLILIAVLVPLMLLTPISPIKRITDPGYQDTASTEVHQALWKVGLEMVRDNPVTGVGLGNFKWRSGHSASMGKYIDYYLMAHNTYLEYAAELGIPAFLLFMGVLISTWTLLEKTRKRATELGNGFFKAAATGMQAGMIGFAGAAFFCSAEYAKPFWILIFLATCMPALLQEEIAPSKVLATAERLEAPRRFLKPARTRASSGWPSV